MRINADVSLLAMARQHTHVLEDRGDLLGGLYMHTLIWMLALSIVAGITGARQKMKDVLAFTSTGRPFSDLGHCRKCLLCSVFKITNGNCMRV